MGALEGRMNVLEGRMSEMEIRVEQRVSALETRLDRRITDVFKWMVGMTVPVWITLFALIITQFTKG